MNVSLGDLEDYIKQKLDKGGYGSAAEVIREALREMRDRETEDAIERRLESYILCGIDQLFETFHRLASQPKMGKARPHWTDQNVLF